MKSIEQIKRDHEEEEARFGLYGGRVWLEFGVTKSDLSVIARNLGVGGNTPLTRQQVSDWLTKHLASCLGR